MLRARSSRLTLLLCAVVFALSQAPWPAALTSVSCAAAQPVSCAAHTMQMCCCRPGVRHNTHAACPMQQARYSTATPCVLKPADCHDISTAPLQVSAQDELPLVLWAVRPGSLCSSTVILTASTRPSSVALDPPFIPPKTLYA